MPGMSTNSAVSSRATRLAGLCDAYAALLVTWSAFLGWKPKVQRVQSLEETALEELDRVYDDRVESKPTRKVYVRPSRSLDRSDILVVRSSGSPKSSASFERKFSQFSRGNMR